MTDPDTARLAEMQRELERITRAFDQLEHLRARITELEAELEAYRELRRVEMLPPTESDCLHAENDRLRKALSGVLDQKAELLAALAIHRGTMAQPAPDEPARYTHNVPPNAPT